MPRETHPTSLLRNAMRSNALFSTVSGLTLVLAAERLSSLIGVPSKWILIGIGLALIGFAIGLFLNARKGQLNIAEAGVAVALDFAWVAGSAVLLSASVLTPSGDALVTAVGAVVLLLAVLQLLGLQRIKLLGAD